MTICLVQKKMFLNNPAQGGEMPQMRTIGGVGSKPKKKDVVFDERSHDMHKKNKTWTIFRPKITTFLPQSPECSDILYKSSRILCELRDPLPRFEPGRTQASFQSEGPQPPGWKAQLQGNAGGCHDVYENTGTYRKFEGFTGSSMLLRINDLSRSGGNRA